MLVTGNCLIYSSCMGQRTFPQLSLLIINNSTWSILNQWNTVIIIRWQSDLVNIKESVLPVCDKPYHNNKKKVK